MFWIVGAGILNSAASSFLAHGGMCGPGGAVVYCELFLVCYTSLLLSKLLIEHLLFDQVLL